MSREQSEKGCLGPQIVRKKFVALCLVAGLLLVLGPVAPTVADSVWTGDGADNLWSNPDNWFGGVLPTEADEVRINGPEAEAPNGPVIQDGIEAVAKVLISDAGVSSMTMTGGHLELAGWGSWWADASGTTATFNMSGGVIDFIGSPGIMELAWQEQGDPPGGSVGIWNMTGGEINALGVDMPGKNYGGIATINLWGGTLNVGTARGGLIMYEGATLDIKEGQLVLEGDQTLQVQDYIDNGWMTAYGGMGELDMQYDGNFTTVTARSRLGLQAGDADQDLDFDQLDLVRVQIAAKYLTGQQASWGEGDWNGAPGGSKGNPPAGDGLFNQLDIIKALAADVYLKGPYAAVRSGGQSGDGQTSVGYNPTTGEVFVDAPAGTQLTSINIDSAARIFTGAPAQNLGGSFDNDADNNIFKATFGSSFGSLSFGNVAQPGLSQASLLADLTVVGSLAGGGALGDVDLIYVPEPSTLALAFFALLAVVTWRRV
jgi:hypothetical protein